MKSIVYPLAFLAVVCVSAQAAGTPVISSSQPQAFGSGAEITIKGSNFGTNPQAVTVSFAGFAGTKTVQAATATPSSLTVFAPPGASSGNLSVTVAGSPPSNSEPYTYQQTPVITQVLSQTTTWRTIVTVNGSGLNSGTGTPAVVLLNSAQFINNPTTNLAFNAKQYGSVTAVMTFTVNSPSQLQFTLPDGLPAATYYVVVTTSGGCSTQSSPISGNTTLLVQ